MVKLLGKRYLPQAAPLDGVMKFIQELALRDAMGSTEDLGKYGSFQERWPAYTEH